MGVTRTRIDVDSTRDEGLSVLREDVQQGLSTLPRCLPAKYFYDAVGSKLFEEITDLPEYYLTRAELQILHSRSSQIVGLNRASTLVELGPGSSLKSRILLEAMQKQGTLDQYVPIEIGEAALENMVTELSRDFPRLFVHAIAGDFASGLKRVPPSQPRLVALLGSTIGNLEYDPAIDLIKGVADLMGPRDLFLLGTDLVKNVETLEAAYNDSKGLTARFNKNILRVLNHRLGADFDPQWFDHHAFFNPKESRIEIHLKANKDHIVNIPGVDLRVRFKAGETIHTENSHKYTRKTVTEMLSKAGLELREWFLDSKQAFALSVSGKSA